MKFLLALVRNPLTLAGSLLLGAVVGKLAPSVAPHLATASSAYLSLLNMGAVPLIVVAVFLGLRRILSLPRAGARLAALVFGGALAMAVCALVAATLAQMAGAGRGMPPAQLALLGSMSLTAEAITTVSINPDVHAAAAAASNWRVPDNFFFALAFGSLPAILLCAVFFAVAFAAQPAAQARWLQAQLEPIYRTLELLIDRLNDFLPVVAFALAASLASQASSEGLLLMRSFLLPYFATVLLVVWACAGAMAMHIGKGQMTVMQALRKPLVVSLFASGPAAAIPGFIQAMCNQLGFRRDLVEFAAPLAPAFLRAGEAVFFAVLAVFVANVYGRTLGPLDVLLICGAATAAALVSVNVSGARSLAAASLVLAYLDLPMEALLPAFVVLEVICEGPRNVLSIMLSGALLALVSKGLPSEAPAVAASPAAAAGQSLRFALTRGRAAVAAALVVLAMAAAYFAGLGLGMRRIQAPDLSQPASVRTLKP